MRSWIKWWLIIYILYLFSSYAGMLHNIVILYLGIGLAYYIFMIRFPVFKKQPTEDVDSGEDL